MNFMEEAKKLEQVAKEHGVDKKIEAELMQKAQEYRTKHAADKSNN